MDNVGDFVQYLGPDMSIKILTHLDDPSDLVRVCAASSSWHRFVIENNISKHLCLRLVPEVLGLARFIEGNIMIKPLKDASNTSAEWERNKINHRVYAFLARGLSSTIEKSCLSEAICASSTDNYPEESMQNTLEPRDRVERRASYWSSKGQSDPEVPETLLYRLASKLCVVTEIHVQPFQAYFQFGFPIYSAKAVRFRMGHPKSPMEMDSEAFDKSQTGSESADGNFVWTYTSPEFPMVQPSPISKIAELDLQSKGVNFCFVSHVKVLGRPLLSPFDVEIDDASGKCALKYRPIAEGPESSLSSAKDEDGGPHSRLRTLSAMLMLRGVRSWEQIILSRIRGAGASVDSNESEDELPA
ncbi:hypothetical protein CDL15_Pgr022924 [Punica granatum]|uniref:F-box domain-containing protein n=1 Tax=Punica granatum TaxID=22663 RepID=A0A218X574_PUNGR|nr:hypothetical protein CDL15_Pgr022924 [Punica granatum]